MRALAVARDARPAAATTASRPRRAIAAAARLPDGSLSDRTTPAGLRHPHALEHRRHQDRPIQMSLKYLTSIAAKGDTDIHKLIGDFADMSKDKIREEAEKLTAAREGQDEARRIDQGLAQAKLDEHHREGMEVVIDQEKAERKEVKKMLKAVEKKKRYGTKLLSKHELKRYNKWKRMTKDERRNLMHAGSLASGGTTAGSGGGAGETDDRVTFEQEEEFEGKKGTHRKKFKQRVPKL